MGNGVEILSRLLASDPQPFLCGGLESGVVPLTFRSQGIDGLEGNGIPLNGKSVVIRECDIFRTASGFGTLVEAFMAARAVM